MTSLYENQLSCDWTTYHIDPARMALFVYRVYYITLFNTTILQSGPWRRGMTLVCVPYVPGSRRTKPFLGSITFYCYSVSYFWFLFPTTANISIFLSRWHSHINFYSQISQFMFCCKDCYACNNWWYLHIVLEREITQNTNQQEYCQF